jgi:hypothetical protein
MSLFERVLRGNVEFTAEENANLSDLKNEIDAARSRGDLHELDRCEAQAIRIMKRADRRSS